MAYTYVNDKTGQVLVTNRRVRGGFWAEAVNEEETFEEETPEEEPVEEDIPDPAAEESAPKKAASRRGKK